MYRHHRLSAWVRAVTQKLMRSFGPDDLEPGAFQSADHIAPWNCW